jgi:hypothetical protein
MVSSDGSSPTAEFQRAMQSITLPFIMTLAFLATEQGRLMVLHGRTIQKEMARGNGRAGRPPRST